MDTLSRLLDACGEALDAVPKRGVGVDRSLVRDMLRRSPAQRLASVPEEADFLLTLDAARRRPSP